MRKIFTLIFATVLLAGCSNMMDAVLNELTDETPKNKTVEEDKEIKTVSDAEVENELIDLENPLNEREIIEKMMSKQRELKKPGFIKSEKDIGDIIIRYFTYNDTFQYSSYYDLDLGLPLISYEGGTRYDKEAMKEFKGEFVEEKKLDHDSINGVYGLYGDSYKRYEMWGESDGNIYNITLSEEEDPDNEKAIELISKSLKTEEEGAYDPLYKALNLDTENIKFPKLHEEYVELDGAAFMYMGYNEKTVQLDVQYRIGGSDTITYSVSDQELEVYDDIFKEDEVVETPGGIEVTIYQHNERKDRIYQWTDGTHFYQIEMWIMDKSLLKANDVYAVIDSAMQDDRKFENKDIFKAINTEPALGKNEKALEKLFIKMKK